MEHRHPGEREAAKSVSVGVWSYTTNTLKTSPPPTRATAMRWRSSVSA